MPWRKHLVTHVQVSKVLPENGTIINHNSVPAFSKQTGLDKQSTEGEEFTTEKQGYFGNLWLYLCSSNLSDQCSRTISDLCLLPWSSSSSVLKQYGDIKTSFDQTCVAPSPHFRIIHKKNKPPKF